MLVRHWMTGQVGPLQICGQSIADIRQRSPLTSSELSSRVRCGRRWHPVIAAIGRARQPSTARSCARLDGHHRSSVRSTRALNCKAQRWRHSAPATRPRTRSSPTSTAGQHPPHPEGTGLPQPGRVRGCLAHPTSPTRNSYRHAYAVRRQVTTAPSKRGNSQPLSLDPPMTLLRGGVAGREDAL
jgi:hypothetical protein